MEKPHPIYTFAYLVLILLFLMSLFLPRKVWSAKETSSKEPASEFIVQNGSQQAKVSVDYSDRKVEVKVIDRKDLDLPNSIQLSFFSKNGKRTDLELSAIQSAFPENGQKYRRDYRGVLPATQNSFVGVELKMPLSSARSTPGVLAK